MSTSTVSARTVFFQDYNANADKFYRVYSVGDWAVFQWGARGVVGQFSAKQHSSAVTAEQACNRQLSAKQAKGYTNLLHTSFQYDPSFMDGSKPRCVQLDDVRQAADGNPAPPPAPATPSGQPVPATPVQAAPSDVHSEFTARALAAITLAVTDPTQGAVEFALLNAAWPELEQVHAKARSYLSTLDSLIIGVSA